VDGGTADVVAGVARVVEVVASSARVVEVVASSARVVAVVRAAVEVAAAAVVAVRVVAPASSFPVERVGRVAVRLVDSGFFVGLRSVGCSADGRDVGSVDRSPPPLSQAAATASRTPASASANGTPLRRPPGRLRRSTSCDPSPRRTSAVIGRPDPGSAADASVDMRFLSLDHWTGPVAPDAPPSCGQIDPPASFAGNEKWTRRRNKRSSFVGDGVPGGAAR
jgi:hypothetical protein